MPERDLPVAGVAGDYPPFRPRNRSGSEPAWGCRRRGLPCVSGTSARAPAGAARVEGKSVAVATSTTKPARPPPPAVTPPATCRSSRGSRRCASAPACTSARPTRRGLMHCLWEIIDNAVDEALAGHVRPHRRGPATPTGRSRCATTAAASRSTSSRGPACPASRWSSPSCTPAASSAAAPTPPSGGLHGVGASVVNALSARLDVEVDRGGKTYAMSFRRGEPGVFADGAAPGRDARTRRSRRTSRTASCAVVGKAPRGRHRHPDPLLGRPADLPQGRRLRLRRAGRPGAADRRSCPGADPGHPRRARAARHARRARPARGDLPATTAASREFVEFLAPDAAGRPTCGGCRAPGTSPRPCRCSTTTGT